MTMETKTSHIAQWLLSTSKVPNEWETFFENEMHGYLNHINVIDKKLVSLIDKLGVLIVNKQLIDHNTYIHHVTAIRDAIGVYGIHSNVWNHRPLWTKYSKEYSSSKYVSNISYKSGSEWVDYFGDYEDINSRYNTCLIVSLSDEGIEYLNKIDKEVSTMTSLSSSYDSVTV